MNVKVDVAIQMKGEYIEAEYRGKDSYDITQSIMQQLFNASEEYQCSKILMVAYAEDIVPTEEHFSLPKMLTDIGFNSNHQLAWVDLNPETRVSTHVSEAILNHKGFNAMLFYNKKDAIKWLVQD